jgi:hypothetical protein
LKPFEEATAAPFLLHPLHWNFRPAAINRTTATAATNQNVIDYKPFGRECHSLLYWPMVYIPVLWLTSAVILIKNSWREYGAFAAKLKASNVPLRKVQIAMRYCSKLLRCEVP